MSGDDVGASQSGKEVDGSRPTFSLVRSCAELYDWLATSTMFQGGANVGLLVNADAFVFMTCAGTLRSIADLARVSRVNDAYALLRKYFDVIMIDTYKNCYVDRERAAGSLIAEQIAAWVRGDDRLPAFKEMIEFIAETGSVAKLQSLLDEEGDYRSLRKRCNDHLHYRFFSNLRLNAHEAPAALRREAVEQVGQDALDLLALHLAYVIALRAYYLAASDYVDHLDMGTDPPPGSQYWVAPIAQQIFDATVQRRLPRSAEFLRANTYMELR